MDHWWHKVYFGNSIADWTIAIGTIIIVGIILYTFKKVVLNRLRLWASKTTNSIDNLIFAGIERSVIPLLYFFIVYGAINYLTIPAQIMGKIKVVIWIIVVFFILRSITEAIKHFIFNKIDEKPDGKAKKRQINGLILIINLIIWILGFSFLLNNIGYDITTLIAGLGIGGIAIALAAQSILGDLFSYFIIYFDKPFEIGDVISFDDKAGTVEYVGLKTTRLRVLNGEQLVCANKDLTDSRVHNFGKMVKRRIVFKTGVVYQTSPEVLEEIPSIIKGIIQQEQDVLFDRCHFMDLGASKLDFETVYYILSADYTVYMNKQQSILLSIFKCFAERNIGFAYPTQTLIVEQQKINYLKKEGDQNINPAGKESS
jgi:small-conductance mechanosensitive channel